MTRGARPAEIVLTGATGFVGKVVLEEMLRRREALGIGGVTVLVRPTGPGKTVDARIAARLKKLLASAAFDGLRRTDPAALGLVRAMGCDLGAKDAGIDPRDRERLAAETTHVVHCAASIAFDAPLEEASQHNITAALEMLALAKSMPAIERMVSVSTAYVTPARTGPVFERLAHLPRSASELYEEARTGRADTRARLAETGHPNTYTYTKCIAEHLLVAERGNVPLTIVRPSIVSAALETPSEGWIDSAAAFAGCMLYVGLGVVRAWEADPGVRLDVVPVDAVARAIVDEAFERRRTNFERPKIRHATMGITRATRIDLAVSEASRFFRDRPGARALPNMFVGRANHGFARADLGRRVVPLALARARLAGEKRRAKRKILDKTDAHVRELNSSFRAFTHHTYDFRAERPLDVPGFEPGAYVEKVLRGIYKHLVRRDETELSFAGRVHDDARTDLAWAVEKPDGNPAMRALAYGLRRATRVAMSRVTFDRPSFERALAAVPADAVVVLAPMHRSYFDFLFTSYLFFQHPELGVRVPHIAAAEEFSKIPLVSRVLTASRAFYVQRGAGKASPELNATLARLAEQEESLLFFVEGQRSRGRRFLAPRRGLLRGLATTGRTFAVVPIAIDYDRVPEEAALERELRGEPRPPMSLGAVGGWLARLARGEIALGRAHFACGETLVLRDEGDVDAVARRIVAEQQRVATVSTYHLGVLARDAAIPGLEASDIQRLLEARGIRVLKSDLVHEGLPHTTRRALESSYLHAFYPDLRKRLRTGPALASHVARNGFWDGRDASGSSEANLDALLVHLFLPVVRDYLRVARAAARAGREPLVARAIVKAERDAFLPDVNDALAELVAREILVDERGSFRPGPRARDLDALVAELAREEQALSSLGGARSLASMEMSR